MILSLKDFVLTGKLGEIAVGSSKSDVLNSLGTPLKINHPGNGTGALIYNGFRFFFVVETKRVYAILCQEFNDSFEEKPTSNVFRISENAEFDTEFFTIEEEVSYRETLKYLDSEGVNYREESHQFWDKIIFESGVEFLFNNWLEYPEDEEYDTGELILCGFRIFPVKSV